LLYLCSISRVRFTSRSRLDFASLRPALLLFVLIFGLRAIHCVRFTSRSCETSPNLVCSKISFHLLEPVVADETDWRDAPVAWRTTPYREVNHALELILDRSAVPFFERFVKDSPMRTYRVRENSIPHMMKELTEGNPAFQHGVDDLRSASLLDWNFEVQSARPVLERLKIVLGPCSEYPPSSATDTGNSRHHAIWSLYNQSDGTEIAPVIVIGILLGVTNSRR
jgi:hypothetical protein